MKIIVVLAKFKQENKYGELPIYIRYSHRSKTFYKTTGLFVKKNEWDDTHKQINNKRKNYVAMNALLSKMKEDFEASVWNARVENEKNFNNDIHFVRNALSQSKQSQNNKKIKTFSDFTKHFVAMNENTFSDATKRRFAYVALLCEQFEKNILLEKIDQNFCIGFENFLKKKYANNNTLSKKIEYFLFLYKKAVELNFCTNKTSLYKKTVKKQDVLKTVLEIAEVKQIEDKLNEMNDGDANISKWFLLACFTGLRFSDVERFSDKWVNNNELILQTKKTSSIVSIPLNAPIIRAIERVKNIPPIISNQKANERLKFIARVCGIDKTISFHTARHTFACICAEIGVPIEVTQKWLGHSDTKITLVYYKLKGKQYTEQSAKFNFL